MANYMTVCSSSMCNKREKRNQLLIVDWLTMFCLSSAFFAHKDVFHTDDLAQIAAEAQQAAPAEIPANSISSGPSAVDHIMWPPFIVVVALLVVSLVIHLVT